MHETKATWTGLDRTFLYKGLDNVFHTWTQRKKSAIAIILKNWLTFLIV